MWVLGEIPEMVEWDGQADVDVRLQAAFDDLWTVLADPKVFVETIIPAVDKLLIRSPETGLPSKRVDLVHFPVKFSFNANSLSQSSLTSARSRALTCRSRSHKSWYLD